MHGRCAQEEVIGLSLALNWGSNLLERGLNLSRNLHDQAQALPDFGHFQRSDVVKSLYMSNINKIIANINCALTMRGHYAKDLTFHIFKSFQQLSDRYFCFMRVVTEKLNYFCPNHKANKQQSQDLNPKILAPEFFSLL